MLTLVGYVAWRFGPRQGSTFITVSSPIGATKVVDKGNLVREFVFVDRKLQGTWVATSMVINGEMAIDDDLAKVQVTFDDRGKFNMAMPDGNWTGLAGTPANLRPKPMFFIVRNGPEDFRARVGVCEVNDDILRICVKWTPVERREDGATDFIAEKGSGRILLIMKRQEKEP